MADNVASVEYEDVLSSIRRLVRDETQTQLHQPQPEIDEKLVLTPSLRVIAEPTEAAVGPSSQEVEDTELVSKPENVDETQSLSMLEATIAELETAVGNTTDFEPDGDQEQDLEEAAPAFFRSSLAQRDRERREQSEDVSKADSFAAQFAFIPKAANEAEANVANVEEDDEPLQLMPADIAPEDDLELADEIEQNVRESNVDEDLFDEDEEVILDEEILRQMVQTVVREELQGAFGEAITRNIRKLIRREIHTYFDMNDNV